MLCNATLDTTHETCRTYKHPRKPKAKPGGVGEGTERPTLHSITLGVWRSCYPQGCRVGCPVSCLVPAEQQIEEGKVTT
jgi:hypothetical protein